MEYWTALTIGLLGSLHCVGMCGPIALALPLNRTNNTSILIGSTLYNLGRLSTYFSIGVLFGLLGNGISLIGFQQWLSISMGILMIFSVVFSLLNFKTISFPTFNLWLGKIKGEMGQRFGKQSNTNLFVIGLLNGLLPCGLIYVAVAAATAMAHPLQGGFFMFIFGLGTIPLLFSVSVFGSQLKKRFTPSLRKLIPVFIVLFGCLFILRGMNLGIPYVSPKFEVESEVIKCH